MKPCYLFVAISSLLLLVNCASNVPKRSEFNVSLEDVKNMQLGELSQFFRKTILTTSLVYSNYSEGVKREAIKTAKALIESNFIPERVRSEAVKDAILYDSPDMFEMLIDAEKDVNRISFDLRRPVLVLATFRTNNPDYVIRLLAAGAEINAQQAGTGFTALHSAVNAGSIELVKILLERGAAVNVDNNYGFTPLDMAIENRSCDIIEVLLKHGASIYNVENLKNLIITSADINAFRDILAPENIEMIKFMIETNLLPSELKGQAVYEFISQNCPEVYEMLMEELARKYDETEEILDSEFVVLSGNDKADEGFVFVL